MQISRHWRLNAQRYRLEGVQLEDGSVSLQDRYVPMNPTEEVEESVTLTEIHGEALAEHKLAS